MKKRSRSVSNDESFSKLNISKRQCSNHSIATDTCPNGDQTISKGKKKKSTKMHIDNVKAFEKDMSAKDHLDSFAQTLKTSNRSSCASKISNPQINATKYTSEAQTNRSESVWNGEMKATKESDHQNKVPDGKGLDIENCGAIQSENQNVQNELNQVKIGDGDVVIHKEKANFRKCMIVHMNVVEKGEKIIEEGAVKNVSLMTESTIKRGQVRKGVKVERTDKTKTKKAKTHCVELVRNNIIPRTKDWWKSELGESWYEVLKDECQKTYLLQCLSHISMERSQCKKIYPPEELLFNAFRTTPLSAIKVVIVGQDPYHQLGQAMGLSFSVPIKVKVPPSLNNMYKEISCDESKPPHGDLTQWAKQGVFLLNSLLTVEEGKPLSHRKFGWETFTDKVVEIINIQRSHVVFLLWGLPARKKGQSVNRERHHVLEAGHPSPLSIKQFAGCNHFNKANEYLIQHNETPIDWVLEFQ